jgi:threonine synthase
MWRHRSALPLTDERNIVTLGEGETPLVPLTAATRQAVGGAEVLVKCEHLNPTGSFKDRIASLALSIAVERGLRGCVGTSSGNGGAAAAAYAARAGLRAVLFALSDVAEQKLLQIRALGGEVYLLDGLGHRADATEAAARRIAELAAAAGFMPFLTGGRFSPEAMEGATTIADEILDEAPQARVIYAPVGGGGLCAALWRGLRRHAPHPRLVAVQPAGCPTLRRALGGDFSGLDRPSSTTISGLQVAVLFDGRGAVEAVRASGGHLVEVSDEEVFAAQELLARDGLLVEPAGAAALAGAIVDARAGRIGADESVVLVATGAGYKDGAALRRLGGSRAPARVGLAQIEEVLVGARV